MKEIDDYLVSMDAKVRKYGWGVVFVGGDAREPSFMYTVGLPRQYDHPEFVLVGVPPGAAVTLNKIAGQVRDGATFTPGCQQVDLLGEFTTELIGVELQQSHANLPVSWRINGGPVDALQIVWPDELDHLPWESGYTISPKTQPLWGSRADIARSA